MLVDFLISEKCEAFVVVGGGRANRLGSTVINGLEYKKQ